VAYTYDNGTIELNMYVKNTGDVIFGLDSVYLQESLIEVDSDDFYTKSGFLNLESNEEDIIVIEIDINDPGDAKYGVTGDPNEEILVCITGGFGEFGTVASDIGYIHTIKDEQHIKIINEGPAGIGSVIYANETGQVLVKNTGNELITLSDIYVNNTLVSNTEYIYGDSTLDIQECAIIKFDIPGFVINKTDECSVRVTTTSLVETTEILKGQVNPVYFNINIEDSGTSAFDSGSVTVLIQNNGKLNVTVNSVFINNTYFSANRFSSDNGYEIGAGGTLELTISMGVIEAKFGTINVDDIIEILVRTNEGAEDIHQETVKA
jgi:hypothetical protein